MVFQNLIKRMLTDVWMYFIVVEIDHACVCMRKCIYVLEKLTVQKRPRLEAFSNKWNWFRALTHLYGYVFCCIFLLMNSFAYISMDAYA